MDVVLTSGGLAAIQAGPDHVAAVCETSIDRVSAKTLRAPLRVGADLALAKQTRHPFWRFTDRPRGAAMSVAFRGSATATGMARNPSQLTAGLEATAPQITQLSVLPAGLARCVDTS